MQISKLITHGEIKEKITHIAEDMIKDRQELNFVVVLKGAKKFSQELIARIKNISNIPINVYEITASSYKGTNSTGKIIIKKDIEESIEDKDVIIIDDILDSGLTLSYLKGYLINEKKANNIEVCVLLNKKKKREVKINPDYAGFNIDDVFVIGYGLDLDEKYRGLDHIGFIPPQNQRD